MHRSLLSLAALCALLPIGSAVSAQVIVHDNFGASDTFDMTSGMTQSGPKSALGTISQGMGFTPSVSGALSDLTVAIGHFDGTNDAHLFLSDGATDIPGATLEAFTLTSLPAFGSAFTPETLTSTLHPMLTAGKTYYLYEKETGDEANAWNFNTTGETNVIYSEDNATYAAYNDSSSGAYRVRVTPTPAPGSLTVFATMGLSGAGWLRRRRRVK